MLLTISTTHRPATDLGFLLHKNPGHRHLADMGFGTAQVFYPEASEERCSAAVLVEIDPVGLVARRRSRAAASSPWPATSTTGRMPRRPFSP